MALEMLRICGFSVMWKRCFALLMFYCALPASLLRAGEAPSESWENLRTLNRGETVEVVDRRMKSHRGAFDAYGEDTITVLSDGRLSSFAREEVASVKRIGRPRRGRNALLGLAAGGAAGLVAGVIKGASYHESGETPVFVGVLTPIGAGIGAGIGAAISSSREVTVYRARPPASAAAAINTALGR